MAVAHVISQGGVLRPAFGVSEVLVETQPHLSLCFAYVGGVRVVTQQARDLIDCVLSSAFALYPRHTRITNFVPRWTFWWVERRTGKNARYGLSPLPSNFDGESR